ncbi:MAG: WG repeat-containing protein [Saprospiraceae bacterium]|nr:WG repeat-containing protein [Saprospiraceae bacterium]
MIALGTCLNAEIMGQNEKIRPIQASNNLWGYKDLENNIVVNPIFDNITPLISNFHEVEPKLLDVKTLLLYNDERTFFKNPIGIVVFGDSIGIVDHQGRFLLNPMKCQLKTVYQESEMKVVENLEEGSDDYGKIALIAQSGLFISSFMKCQLEDYEGGNLDPHQYYYRDQAVENLLLQDCQEFYNTFINQTDGFIKFIPDSIYIILATDGFYFAGNSQKQKIDLFHNDTYIKSIVIPENFDRLTYYTNGIFSVTNGQNTILMDTSGKIYYTIENGTLEGVNDHGHAKIFQNQRFLYIDSKGNQILETSINEYFYSNKDGYHYYKGDSIVHFDKSFKKITTVISDKALQDSKGETLFNSDIFIRLCQDSFYYLEQINKNLSNLRFIKLHEIDHGKYNIIEFELENGHYFYSKCGKEPFFPFENVYDFKYIGNDIFFIYVGGDVIKYHYLKGELSKFNNDQLNQFTFQGKVYYYTYDSQTDHTDIYDKSLKKLNRSYKNFNKSYEGIECEISPFIENGKFLFEIFGHKGVINLEKLDPQFGLANIKFWHHRNMADSYSIFMGIRNNLSFHILELNFSNIIENPQDYKVFQYLLDYDPLLYLKTNDNFFDSPMNPKVNVIDSLICVMLTDNVSTCLNMNKRTIIKIGNDVLSPEYYSFYHNRQSKIDCYEVGYVDKQGRQIIPPIYYAGYSTSFKHGVAIVLKFKNQVSYEKEYGLIDTMGSFLIPLSDCELKFDNLGKAIIKECRNEDGNRKFSFYDLNGKFLDDFEYFVNEKDFLYASLPSGGYRVFTDDINHYIDVEKAVIKNDQLWVKKEGIEYTLTGNKLIITNQSSIISNQGRYFILNGETSIQVDDALLVFVQNSKQPIAVIEGHVNNIDYKNELVYIKDKYDDVLVYSFKGEILLEANHSYIEYYPKYKLFIKSNYNNTDQRTFYQYHYID